MNRFFKFTMPVAIATVLASSAISARFEDRGNLIDSNPFEQIETQIDSVNVQVGLIQTSLSILPRNAVSGPIVTQEVNAAIDPHVEQFETLSNDVENTLLSSLEVYEGQYENAAMPNALSKKFLSQLPTPNGDQEFQCLAEALYFEARGESLQGQRAVAEVILNRMNSKRYPNTICGVVNQGTGKKHQCQFSYTCDGIPDVVREKNAYTRGAKIARLMIDGLYDSEQLTSGALFYHTTGVNPSWAKSMTRTTQLGVHLFYRQ